MSYNAEGDFVVILSSQMISDIVQQYFNNEMYKKKVEVVDTKATETGYAFSVVWYSGGDGVKVDDIKEDVKQQVDIERINKQHKEIYDKAMNQGRNGKGRYTKVDKEESKV